MTDFHKLSERTIDSAFPDIFCLPPNPKHKFVSQQTTACQVPNCRRPSFIYLEHCHSPGQASS